MRSPTDAAVLPLDGPPVDLRSDTVTRPSMEMRQAIAGAKVGDDALGDDPTVHLLEDRVATLLGKEAAVFFPSGIMANQTAIHVLSERGTEVVLEASAHILDWEDGAPALWSAVQLRGVAAESGVLDPGDVAAAIRPRDSLRPRTSLLCLENTHNAAGGKVLPVERMAELAAISREHDVPVHLDGARLWNAAAATGRPESDWAAHADTVMVALSKGLGCPVGSLLAGTREVMARARRTRRRLGGTMRQAGILAAAGLYALEHNRDRLVEDHARAAFLAGALADLPGVRVVAPETNIVMLDLDEGRPGADDVAARAHERGVYISTFGPRRVRMVTHLDVNDAALERAVGVMRELLG